MVSSLSVRLGLLLRGLGLLIYLFGYLVEPLLQLVGSRLYGRHIRAFQRLFNGGELLLDGSFLFGGDLSPISVRLFSI